MEVDGGSHGAPFPWHTSLSFVSWDILGSSATPSSQFLKGFSIVSPSIRCPSGVLALQARASLIPHENQDTVDHVSQPQRPGKPRTLGGVQRGRRASEHRQL
jgi:hypothetical protein